MVLTMPIRIFAATCFALLVLLGAAQTSSSVRELAPGVFVRMGDRTRNQPANSGWVVFQYYVLVIDANFPWGAREILQEIKKTTNKPIRFLFNTHYHGDHAFGSSIFTDEAASLVCSEACAQESRTKGQAGWDKNTATGEYSLKPYKLSHPTVVFKDAMSFDDGQHRVELLLMGPGHSRGDAVAWLPKEKILFAGDLCVNWNFGNNLADADGDHPNWLRALDRMAALQPQTVVVGHGDLGPAHVLAAQKAYISDLMDAVRAGIRNGKTADQLAAEVDMSKHKIGTDKDRNAASVRAVHRQITSR